LKKISRRSNLFLPLKLKYFEKELEGVGEFEFFAFFDGAGEVFDGNFENGNFSFGGLGRDFSAEFKTFTF